MLSAPAFEDSVMLPPLPDVTATETGAGAAADPRTMPPAPSLVIDTVPPLPAVVPPVAEMVPFTPLPLVLAPTPAPIEKGVILVGLVWFDEHAQVGLLVGPATRFVSRIEIVPPLPPLPPLALRFPLTKMVVGAVSEMVPPLPVPVPLASRAAEMPMLPPAVSVICAPAPLVP